MPCDHKQWTLNYAVFWKTFKHSQYVTVTKWFFLDVSNKFARISLNLLVDDVILKFKKWKKTSEKETRSKHKSTKLLMSHLKTLSTTNTRNPTTVPYLSLPTTQVYQILIMPFKNIILFLRPLIAAKMPLKIPLFLPAAALEPLRYPRTS